jgi:hypothetical protein
MTGSQVGTGRVLSSAVRSASASISGVDGADVMAHSAFFFAGSVLRFNLNDDAADVFLSDTDGFCARIVPFSGRDERILKPANVSSEGRVWNPDVRFRRYRFPNGVKLEYT